MNIWQRIIAHLTAPCYPSVELPAALPNGKPIWLVNDNGKLSTVQECPNCEGAGFLSRPSVFSSIDPAAPAVNLPCNRCDCTGVIHG